MKKAKILEILRSHQPEQEKAAASLPEAWKKIDSWLRAKKPKVLASLNPGIDEKSLGTLSKSVGATLPEDLVALLKIHDGQKDQEPAFLPSPDQDAPYALLPSANILKEWKLQNELLESGDFSRKAVADRGILRVAGDE